MTKFKNLKKVIINPRFLYTIPLAGVGLLSTQQSANAMFNPRNYNPRIKYFYATETRHPMGVINTKTTTTNINTKSSSLINPNSNIKNSPIIFSHISSKVSGKPSPKPNYVSTLNVNLNNKPRTPDTEPKYVSTLNVPLNTKTSNSDTKTKHVSTLSIHLNAKTKTDPKPSKSDTKPKTTPTPKPEVTPTPKSSELDAKPKTTPASKPKTKASDLPKSEVTPTPKPSESDNKPNTRPSYINLGGGSIIFSDPNPKTSDLGARPKTTAPKPSNPDTKSKIELKPVTYVTTGLEAKRKSLTAKSENNDRSKYVFNIDPPTKPHSEFLVPDGTHIINGRIDVKPDMQPGHYTPQNSRFLDMLRARFKPVSQSAPDNYTTQQNQSNEKTSSNSAQQTKTSTSNALQNKNPQVEPDITPIYDSPPEKIVKKVSNKFGEEIQDLSKSTLKSELKNQNKNNEPFLKETIKFKTKVTKLSKKTLKNQIDKHLSNRIFKENAKIEKASEDFGNVMGNIAYANLESYLENNNKKGKSSKEIKSLSKDFGKYVGSIASSELSVRLLNLDDLLK